MKILIVDDDRVLADLLAFTFRREKYDVIQAYDGKTALRRWREDALDLVLLDVNLPDIEGFTLCRSIRAQSSTPVILLTVRGDEDDIVHGFENGADDYIAKPFSPRQLVARTKAVLRRAGSPTHPTLRQVGALKFDPIRRELHLSSGKNIPLSSLENQLLDYLFINVGQVLTFDMIIDHVWGPDGGTRSMVRQLIYRLRTKIEAMPSPPLSIQSVAGIGYELLQRPEN